MGWTRGCEHRGAGAGGCQGERGVPEGRLKEVGDIVLALPDADAGAVDVGGNDVRAYVTCPPLPVPSTVRPAEAAEKFTILVPPGRLNVITVVEAASADPQGRYGWVFFLMRATLHCAGRAHC